MRAHRDRRFPSSPSWATAKVTPEPTTATATMPPARNFVGRLMTLIMRRRADSRLTGPAHPGVVDATSSTMPSLDSLSSVQFSGTTINRQVAKAEGDLALRIRRTASPSADQSRANDGPRCRHARRPPVRRSNADRSCAAPPRPPGPCGTSCASSGNSSRPSCGVIGTINNHTTIRPAAHNGTDEVFAIGPLLAAQLHPVEHDRACTSSVPTPRPGETLFRLDSGAVSSVVKRWPTKPSPSPDPPAMTPPSCASSTTSRTRCTATAARAVLGPVGRCPRTRRACR